jgi:histone H3/H4
MAGESSRKGTWKKGGGDFGPIKKGSRTLGIKMPSGNVGKPGTIRKPARFKSGEKALLEIRKYQRDGGYLIPQNAFIRLAREIFDDVAKGKDVTRFERSAMEALQTLTEDHMSILFNSKFSKNCNLIVIMLGQYDFDGLKC